MATITISSPPMNLIGGRMLPELDEATDALASDPDVMVVILKSSTPGFFIGHAKFGDIAQLTNDVVPETLETTPRGVVHVVTERLRIMDKLTIAQVEGRATGGGAALALACDLRYGALGKAVFNSFGVSLATGLGGGASQYLPRVVGVSRALELILGAYDLDAETADRWGYLTRAFPAETIDENVRAIATRIASYSPEVIRQTRRLVASALDGTIEEGLRDEAFVFQQFVGTDDAVHGISRLLQLGGETIEGESNLGELLGQIELKRTDATHEQA
ncbi:enoyl-CoA hydratase/isomerase family protein [Microbacterium pygmaeum]|uniref:enoyl-CoA hydratase/isomerase family protein n=1 Tax=Microbacterium pygmaeum TaxID=370764 RepID=UPI0012FBF6BF|nr:enoyl-CoA hydratase/isomerase family protein [Microbacterium pygmaeum]